jgi:hypothetical protein
VHGRWLYVAAKDNSCVVRYDISALVGDPHASYAKSEVVLRASVSLSDGTTANLLGHSALAINDGYLYVAYRTSSLVVRYRMGADGKLAEPVVGELIAKFEAYDARTNRSANLTDIAFDRQQRLYVLSASPSRIWRIKPDPTRVLDATDRIHEPWLDLATLTGNPAMKSENILVDDAGRIYITAADAYDATASTHGAVYRYTPAL